MKIFLKHRLSKLGILPHLLKRKLIKLHFFLAEQFGIDPRRSIAGVRGFPAFLRDLYKFRRHYQGALALNPCLGDRYQEGGSYKNEYFWQDLLVAQRVFKEQPVRHVDVGSRIDGFVAHIASFREVEVFDIRPVTSAIPSVVFRQADLMSQDSVSGYVQGGHGYCDSLSCLHAIEHFGLGRYGDPVDPQGYVRGIDNLARLLSPGGRLYLSTPIGQQRVEFNANWVFAPSTIVETAAAAGLTLDELTVLDQRGGKRDILRPRLSDLEVLGQDHYHLGIFHFTKAQPAARQ